MAVDGQFDLDIFADHVFSVSGHPICHFLGDQDFTLIRKFAVQDVGVGHVFRSRAEIHESIIFAFINDRIAAHREGSVG